MASIDANLCSLSAEVRSFLSRTIEWPVMNVAADQDSTSNDSVQPEAGGRPGTSKISSWPISAAPKQIDWASRQAPHLAAGPGRVWRGTATARTCPLA